MTIYWHRARCFHYSTWSLEYTQIWCKTIYAWIKPQICRRERCPLNWSLSHWIVPCILHTECFKQDFVLNLISFTYFCLFFCFCILVKTYFDFLWFVFFFCLNQFRNNVIFIIFLFYLYFWFEYFEIQSNWFLDLFQFDKKKFNNYLERINWTKQVRFVRIKWNCVRNTELRKRTSNIGISIKIHYIF